MTSDSTLQVGAFDCAGPSSPGCESAPSIVHIESGTATLENGTLSVTLVETLTECGYSWPGTFTFTGSAS